MPTTPNMGMTLPTVGVTVDPTWASNLNDALTNKVDAHDHTTGLGVRVPTAGLNINADLSFQSNDATNLRSVALNNNVSTLPSGDIRALYASSGNLYYNNNSGVPVRITNGSSLDTGSLALNVWQLTELAGNLTILNSDSFVVINTDTSSARTINLPDASSVTAGRYYIIKDKTGDAVTNAITVTPAGSDTIDETASSTTVGTPYGTLTLISDGVSNWLTNASLGGTVRLGGDLLGTGSTAASPRVGSLTGIAGLVTMANNTALNSRNSTNSSNVNLIKIDGSNVVQVGDTSFATTLQGTSLTLSAATTSLSATANTTASVQAGTNLTLTALTGTANLVASSGGINIDADDNIVMDSATGTVQVTAQSNIVVSSNSGQLGLSAGTEVVITSGSDHVHIVGGTDVDIVGSDDVSITANNGTVTATSFSSMALTAGTSLTLAGQLHLPTKAVTGASYNVDTTTKDVILFCDSTSNAISINLPAASNGRILFIQDVAGTAATNNITLVPSGSDEIQGLTSNYVMDADYQGITLAAYSGGSWFIIGTS